jgi:hypothetical protein
MSEDTKEGVASETTTEDDRNCDDGCICCCCNGGDYCFRCECWYCPHCGEEE